MRKLLSITLAIALMIGLLSTGAFAAGREGYDTLGDRYNSSYSVNIELSGGQVTHKYCVDITYPSTMVFTYSKENTVWNPATYEYDNTNGSTDSGWSNGYTFTITNHSDLPIHYAASVSDLSAAYGDLSIVLGNAEADISACQVGDTDGIRNAEFTVNVTGTPNDALTENEVTLGNVDIVITAPSS